MTRDPLRDVVLMVGAGFIGAGIAMAGAAVVRGDRPADAGPTLYNTMFGLTPAMPPAAIAPAAPLRCPGVLTPFPPPVTELARADRARRVRVLVYRIRCGELTLASPEVAADVSRDVADQLEGYTPPMPCAAALGALPLDWQ